MLCKANHVSHTYLMLQRQLSHLNPASHSSSIVSCVWRQSCDLVAVETCLQSHSLAKDVFSGSIPALGRYITLFIEHKFHCESIIKIDFSFKTERIFLRVAMSS
jgi:hypothetical protein